MHKLIATTFGLTIFAVASLGACGSSDSGSNTNPVNGAAGTTAFAGNSAAAGKSSVAGNSASTGVGGALSTSGTSGTIALAGRSGSTAGAGGADEEDGGVAGASAGTSGTGVAGSLAAGAGAAGSTAAGTGGSGSAGQAGGTAGHSGQGGSTAGQGGSGAGAATFTQVYKIFMTNCTGSTCHVGSTRAADGLAMNDKMSAYMNLVGANSVSCMGLKRVVAGSSSTSELVNTLKHTAATGCFNTPRMPDGKPMLSATDIATITSWIDAGALNN